MNQDPSSSIPQQDLVPRYEQLRSDALTCSHSGSGGFGLAVLLREGMTAWMQACSRPVIPPTHEFVQPDPINPLPGDVRTEAVLILAGMLLGKKSEANPCKPTLRK